MILRFLFIVVIVPFLRAWPRLFAWLESAYNEHRSDADDETGDD